ncbi:MAG: hypothetical protein M1129_03915 [Candidatus Thermoplasmatota archaeon]|nr:hypothetical protein [Candidatus Thermoplasmatota archaeon]MCL5955574.1 hypothetical protein [Candidatus Thermoplasmatota archaeon]
MALFANDTKKVKTKKAKEPKAVKRRSRFSNEGVETVVEVKTVGDIPPVLEARKQIGESDLNKAAQTLFRAACDDYAKYFRTGNSNNDGNRHFFIKELGTLNVKVPEVGYVDSSTILEAMEKVNLDNENLASRVNALKKLTSFYLNYYEKARYSGDYDFDGEELVSRFSEIYNYMDIMQLYFARHDEGIR